MKFLLFKPNIFYIEAPKIGDIYVAVKFCKVWIKAYAEPAILGGIIFYYRIVNGVSKNAVVRELQTNLSKQRNTLSVTPSFKSKPFIQHKNIIGYKV